jgi:hypothetical protein
MRLKRKTKMVVYSTRGKIAYSHTRITFTLGHVVCSIVARGDVDTSLLDSLLHGSRAERSASSRRALNSGKYGWRQSFVTNCFSATRSRESHRTLASIHHLFLSIIIIIFLSQSLSPRPKSTIPTDYQQSPDIVTKPYIYHHELVTHSCCPPHHLHQGWR